MRTSSPVPFRRRRRAGAVDAPPGFFGTLLETVSRGDVLLRLGLCLAAAAVLLVAWAAAAWSYRAVSSGSLRRVGMTLRTAALSLLSLCLLEPLWIGQRARPGAGAHATHNVHSATNAAAGSTSCTQRHSPATTRRECR